MATQSSAPSTKQGPAHDQQGTPVARRVASSHCPGPAPVSRACQQPQAARARVRAQKAEARGCPGCAAAAAAGCPEPGPAACSGEARSRGCCACCRELGKPCPEAPPCALPAALPLQASGETSWAGCACGGRPLTRGCRWLQGHRRRCPCQPAAGTELQAGSGQAWPRAGQQGPQLPGTCWAAWDWPTLAEQARSCPPRGSRSSWPGQPRAEALPAGLETGLLPLLLQARALQPCSGS